MAIMTVQVARIVWFYILGGIMGILLPTSKGLAERVAKRLSPDRFEAIAMEKLTPDRFEAIAMQKLTPDRFEAIAMQKLTPDRLRQLAEQQEREAEEQLPA